MQTRFAALFASMLLAGPAPAQFSAVAYRALGQPDLRQNGINMVQGVEMYNPSSVAVDARDGGAHLYVADAFNNRVLAWRDIGSYQNGDAPAIFLGQPGPQYSGPLGIGTLGFANTGAAMMGMAVDPLSGNLYVVDPGNNRVLRFPSPFANPARIEPDMVYGQQDFNGRGANWDGVSGNSMQKPQGLAFDAQGNLWVADSGNHRVLRFNAASLETPAASADLVLGQGDLFTGAPDRGGRVSASGFHTPIGLAFDAQGNLYVSEFDNGRVMKFTAPLVAGAAAAVVLGQPNFTAAGLPGQASASTMAGPSGLAVDPSGDLYVAVPNENRVLTFAANSITGAAAKSVLGQTDFTGRLANPSAFPYAAAGTFAQATDVKFDPSGNLIVADSGNNRVLYFPRGVKTASLVWGQVDFTSNGPNRIKPGSINTPYKIAVDYSQTPYALYVSDTTNNRVLAWRDAVRFRTGDPADLVIGQPNFGTALANADNRGARPSAVTLSSPKGIAVDLGGNLYVADSGNHRVLRYPRPLSQGARVTPDLVLGQRDFNSFLSAAVNASSLRSPAAVAIGPDGDIFVADSGNNRVVEYSGSAGTGASAIRVYGQPDFITSVASASVSAQTLSAPAGLFVDLSFTLYVADTGANRVLVFPDTRDTPMAGAAASLVIGQPTFDSGLPAAGGSGLRSPVDVALDSSGDIVVSDNGNNRAVVYPSLIFLPVSGGVATAAVGQKDLNGRAANWDSSDGLATSRGLSGPLGIFVDRVDTLYVGDSGNNRVLHYLKPAVVANMANPQSGTSLARGALGALSGAGLSNADEQSSSSQLAPALANRQLVVNDDVIAPLSHVAPNRVSFQLPSASPVGLPRLALRLSDTGELLAGATAPVAVSAPALFTSDSSGQGQGKITNADGSDNSSAAPAARGSIVKIFGTGQGPVSPTVPDGQAAPSDSPVSTIAVPTTDGQACLRQQSVCVAIGSTFGEIQFSGLAPGQVGIWELDVKISPSAPTGNSVPLRAVINGTPSNIVAVAIR